MAKKMNISRRSFLVGGSAALAAAGLSLSSCVGTNAVNTTNAESGAMTAVISQSCAQWEPVGNYNISAVSAGWHVYEGLYYTDRRNGEANDALADGNPIKIDDLKYEIRIKQNVRFSDGSILAPMDVVNSIAENMSNSHFDTFFSFIKSVDDNKNSIVINLNYPISVEVMKKRLSIICVHKHLTSGSDDKNMYIGTGPYAYKSIDGQNGGKVEFVPNSHYNGDFPPRAKLMIWYIRESGDARVDSLKGNNSFVCEDTPITHVENLKSKAYKVDLNESMSMPVFMFNSGKAPFNDVRVRQAVLYAVNETKLIKEKLNGYAEEALCFLPLNHPNYHQAKNAYSYDPEKAKQLLVQAKQEKLNFTLAVSDVTGLETFTDEISKNLSDIGISCKVNVKKISFSDLLIGEDHLEDDALFTIIDPSIFGNDIDLLLSILYGDDDINRVETHWPESINSRFNEMQQLLKTGREATGQKQSNAWNDALDLISEEVPIYPIFHRSVATAYNERLIKDFRSINCSGIDMLSAAPVNK